MVRYPSSPKLGRPRNHEQETSLTNKKNDEIQTGGDSPAFGPPGKLAERVGDALGGGSALERLLTNISGNLRKLVARKEEEEDEQAIVDEWKLMAKAVDRICLIVFVGSSVILIVVLGSEMLRRN